MFINQLDDEITVLQRLQAGDENSFNAVYQHYYPFVKRQVERLMHSPEMSEDVTQEIFMKIWEGREHLSEVRVFKAYLFIIARNHTFNVLKSIARSSSGMSEIIRHFDRSVNTTEDQVQDNEYMRFIRKKIDELPPRTKEIFILCREQSKTYNEVAAELGISRDAVKNRMVHAMKMLKRSIIPTVILFVLIHIKGS